VDGGVFRGGNELLEVGTDVDGGDGLLMATKRPLELGVGDVGFVARGLSLCGTYHFEHGTIVQPALL